MNSNSERKNSIRKDEQRKESRGKNDVNNFNTLAPSLETLSPKITNSFFCFKCGSIMTTEDDHIQHVLREQKMSENGESGEGDV